MIFLALAIALPGFAGFYFFGSSPKIVVKSYPDVMNTVLQIKIVENSQVGQSLPDTLAADLKSLGKRLDRFDPASEVSKVNRNSGLGPVAVSNETFQLVAAALSLHQKTKGSFNPTVGPLSDLWQIMMSSKIPEDTWQPPDNDSIQRVLSLTGSDTVNMDPKMKSIFLPKTGQSLDLGGIAKGYAVEKAGSYLRSAGINNFLIELGGNVYVEGRHPGGKPWKIGIQHPRKPGEIIAWIELSGAALSTSGDYESYRVHQGKHYGHILDPRTGKPASDLVSVTVVSPFPTEADALSTAAFVLGPVEGLKLLEEWPEAEGIFVDRDMRVFTTSSLNGKVHVKS